MSSSSDIADSGRFTGQRAPARGLEKSSFSQTCSLLSQYIKEKGTFGDLSLGMTCNLEGNGTPESLRQTATTTTMNLFPMTERSAGVSGIPARNMNLKSMNLFPQQAGFGSSVSKDDAPKIVNSSVKKSGNVEPQTAQMTIFYGGQVIVFNDFPADKAKEVMRLAGMGSSPVPSTTVKNPIDAGGMAPSTPNVVPNFANSLIQERIQRPAQPVACELPIARKASLHRFLEKRKDRITARAPYNISNTPAGPHKPAESKSWLGLAAKSPK